MKQVPERFNISIFGTSYSIISDEPEMIARLANSVEQAMRCISEKTESQDAQKLAVLVALQFAHKLQEAESGLQAKERKISLLIDSINQQVAQFTVS